MKASLRLGRLFGIPIYLHVSLLLLVPLLAYVFASAKNKILGFPLGFGGLGLEANMAVLLGSIAALLLLLSILLHEVGHSVVAMRHGVPISRITLWIFGGVSSMEETPRQPRLEESIALMGPGVSGGLGVLFLALRGAASLFSFQGSEGITTLLGIMGIYNFFLGAFNLIPAFPMDGGRVLRAALARRIGFVRATDRAASVGKAFALAFAIVGIFGNFWLILLALFLYMAAAEEEKATHLTVSLEGVSVGEVMNPHTETLAADATVAEFLDRALREQRTGYPVVRDGQVVGVVSVDDTEGVPREAQEATRVFQIMSREFPVFQSNAEAVEAFRAMSRTKANRAVVMEGGHLAGELTVGDIMRAVHILAQRRAA